MTPASYSMLALIDRWHLMLTTLIGGPLPEPPDAVGRVHRLPWGEGRDAVRERWDREHAALLDDGDGAAVD